MSDAQLAAELNGGRFLREQGVGTGVDDEAVDALGLDDAAERRPGFREEKRTCRRGARMPRPGRSSRRRR
jgi:hypothetical protein